VDVAQHIHKNAHKIDSALAAGSTAIVGTISWVTVPGKKDRDYFSFATKYCSWHNPEAYPICDSNVKKYLRRLQKESDFAMGFDIYGDDWTYPDFRKAMDAFRKHYGLGSFTYKEIDKFLWLYGGNLP
jgi:hypothetical protein